MTQSIIDLKNVDYSYRTNPVIQGIDLNVKKGQFVGIIGPNGSGKTTLLKVILGLLRPTSGSVRLFGSDTYSLDIKKRIGYVPQKPKGSASGFPVTVNEIVSMGLVPNGILGSLDIGIDDIENALNAVGMSEYKNNLISELSGGQVQRVHIARAIVSKPELLILDEPTVGVDVESQAMFYQLLRKLKKDHNLTLILVSHDIDVVAHEVDEIACINCKLICHGKPKDVMKGDFMEQLYGRDLKFIIHGH